MFKIITSGNPSDLNSTINNYISEGWKVVGSHQVVVTRSQNRYSGSQHMDTLNHVEYSVSLSKETEVL
jgi:hypothetical protein